MWPCRAQVIVIEYRRNKMAAVTPNRKLVQSGNGLGPITRIASFTTGSAITEAELDGTIQALEDDHTIAAVTGDVGDTTIYVAVQGGPALTTSAGDYYAGVTLTNVVTFDQADKA